jgi:ubiquinone/menaquinone biosynthesis C-methylase UbiE
VASGNPLSEAQPWNLVADGYVEVAPCRCLGCLARWLSMPLRAGIGPDMRVVDVATGPGTVACRVAKMAASVDAIDFSAEMVARCRARAATQGLHNVTVVQGDGQALPYADGNSTWAFPCSV